MAAVTPRNDYRLMVSLCRFAIICNRFKLDPNLILDDMLE